MITVLSVQFCSKIRKFCSKKNGKDIEGGRCMRGKDGSLGFSENFETNWKSNNENNVWN